MWHRRVRKVMINVSTRSWPIGWRGREKTGTRRRYGRVRFHVHEIEMVCVRMRIVVSGHKQVRLVFSDGWGVRCGAGLHGLSQTRKVKLVGVAFAVDFSHDVLVVVVAQGPAQLVVVHVGLALAFSPAPSDLVWIHHFEFSVGAFPGNTAGIGALG